MPTTVLFVHQDVAVRRLVAESLARAGGFEVLTAPSGTVGLARFEQRHPDLVLLDSEMPGQEGPATLVALRVDHPDVPVLMLVGPSGRRSPGMMEVLAHGATDTCIKPAEESLEAWGRLVEADVAPRLHALARPGEVPTAAPVARPSAPPLRIDAVAMGISTGGPKALFEVLPELPADLPVPVFVVQHMPAGFTAMLAERLDGRCRLRVVEGEHGRPVEAGRAYLAPGGLHMTLRRRDPVVEIALDDGPMEQSCRPAFDPLLRSVVEVYGGHALGVVMTGMGEDGAAGAALLAGAGGPVLVQDRLSSIVWGMPGAVLERGVPAAQVPVARMAGAIVEHVLRERGGDG